MKLTIFYSWQNTTETKYNRYFILNCIKKATKKIENKSFFKNTSIQKKLKQLSKAKVADLQVL